MENVYEVGVKVVAKVDSNSKRRSGVWTGVIKYVYYLKLGGFMYTIDFGSEFNGHDDGGKYETETHWNVGHSEVISVVVGPPVTIEETIEILNKI